MCGGTDRQVLVSLALLVHRFQSTGETAIRRDLANEVLPSHRPSPDVGEAEEVERRFDSPLRTPRRRARLNCHACRGLRRSAPRRPASDRGRAPPRAARQGYARMRPARSRQRPDVHTLVGPNIHRLAWRRPFPVPVCHAPKFEVRCRPNHLPLRCFRRESEMLARRHKSRMLGRLDQLRRFVPPQVWEKRQSIRRNPDAPHAPSPESVCVTPRASPILGAREHT